MENGILLSARTAIISGFKALPVIMVSFIGFLSIGLGNLGLFVLFLGHTLLLPIAVYLSQFAFEAINKNDPDKSKYHVQLNQASSLVAGSGGGELRVNVAPSFWLAHVLFLLGYMLANAVSVMSIPDDPKIDPILKKNRRVRAGMIMATTIMMALIVSLLRYNTHSETFRGVIIAFGVGGLLGYGWYQFAVLCGARAADVFGMAQQIIPSSAKDEKPMTCVYAPKP